MSYNTDHTEPTPLLLLGQWNPPLNGLEVPADCDEGPALWSRLSAMFSEISMISVI